MKIGGQMWQAGHFQQKSFNYGEQMNRAAVKSHEASMQSYGSSLFDAQATMGQEMARLTLENVASQVQEQAEAMFAEHAGTIAAVRGDGESTDTGTVLDEIA